MLALGQLTPCVVALADEPSAESGPETTMEASAYYYALPDQSDVVSVVGSYERGSLHLEARYNYEELDSASAFVGWKFAGGDAVTFEVTPIVGVLGGSVHGIVPGVEASVAYGRFDAYAEAEYVHDTSDHSASYFFTWDELGWSPRDWLRVGLVGQRTRVIKNNLELERGLFGQVIVGKAQFGIYVMNPGASHHYLIGMVAVSF